MKPASKPRPLRPPYKRKKPAVTLLLCGKCAATFRHDYYREQHERVFHNEKVEVS